MLASSSPAQAGEYDVYYCATPGGANTPITGWRLDWTVSYITASHTCGQVNGLVVLGLGTAQRSGGQGVLAEVYAPWGISFKRAIAKRTVTLTPGADYSASPYFTFSSRQRTGATIVHEDCAAYAGCFDLDGEANVDVGTASSVKWAIGCGGAAGGWCEGGNERAKLALRSVHLVASDELAPKGTAPSGSALSSATLSKIETAQIEATDDGSGVVSIAATLDGRPAGSVGGVGPYCHDEDFAPGPRDYSILQPCAPELSRTLQVDTTVVPDGSRKLLVVISDAAGNTYPVVDKRVVIDNIPAPVSLSPPTISTTAPLTDLRVGDTLSAVPGGWNGQGISLSYQWERWSTADDWSKIPGATKSTYQLTKDDIGRKIRVVVTATNADSSVPSTSASTESVKSGQTVQVASAGPQTLGEGPAPQLVVDREQRTVQVHYGAKIVVTGKLVDADGQPIADADVDVFEQVSVVGAPWRKVTTVRTDSQGGYVYKPVTQGSRVLRFAYSARRDTGDYRATREVVISVTAAMSIKAKHRTISSRGLIHLQGRVRAKPLPESGTWVEIQVLDAGVWRTIGTRKTSKRGRWSFRHRVRSVSNVTFTFRVRLRPVANVPAAESKSTPVKVRVR